MSLEEKNQISHRRRAIERMSVLLRVLLKDGEFELRSRPG
jgi:hypothetical protein